MNKPKAIIVGDTSSFHHFSSFNFRNFCTLVEKKYELILKIPYDFIECKYIDYGDFIEELQVCNILGKIKQSDLIIVHGEGLLEEVKEYNWKYLYYSRLGKELGKTNWLVNFCMYNPLPFYEYLQLFDYIACRDKLTLDKLKRIAIHSELSFDCCVHNFKRIIYKKNYKEWIGLVRGEYSFSTNLHNVKKINCCWKWEDRQSIDLRSATEALLLISSSKGLISSSFHGCIASFLSGVPFKIAEHPNIQKRNPKHRSIYNEIYDDQDSYKIDDRRLLCEYFNDKLSGFKERSLRNVI
jgi:hypothetical protein